MALGSVQSYVRKRRGEVEARQIAVHRERRDVQLAPAGRTSARPARRAATSVPCARTARSAQNLAHALLLAPVQATRRIHSLQSLGLRQPVDDCFTALSSSGRLPGSGRTPAYANSGCPASRFVKLARRKAGTRRRLFALYRAIENVTTMENGSGMCHDARPGLARSIWSSELPIPVAFLRCAATAIQDCDPR